MKFVYLENDTEIHWDSKYLKSEEKNLREGYSRAENKQENLLDILSAYERNSRLILFDLSNKKIISKMEALGIPPIQFSVDNKEGFKYLDYLFLYFTSGTNGNPVGAFKTRKNITAEIEVWGRLLKKFNITKVIVTVPFMHLYGSLFGIFLPMYYDIDVFYKEQFFPGELDSLIEPGTLIVTTPIYIRAILLNQGNKKYKDSVFISSTSPLDPEIGNSFIDRFDTNLIQIYGSTETGGIAFKVQKENLWSPIETVRIDRTNDNYLKVKSEFVSPYIYDSEIIYTNGEYVSLDYIEIENDKFRLVGRNSQIFKVAGKRYSTIDIEKLLENIPEIRNVIVVVHQSDQTGKGDQLEIILESVRQFTNREILSFIKEKIPNLRIPMQIRIVEKIAISPTGKKILP